MDTVAGQRRDTASISVRTNQAGYPRPRKTSSWEKLEAGAAEQGGDLLVGSIRCSRERSQWAQTFWALDKRREIGGWAGMNRWSPEI